MGLKSRPPSAAVAAARAEVLEVLRRHQPMEPIEMVAVLAQTLGQMLALLDQRQFTPAQAMQVVGENLAAGNAAQIEQVIGTPRGTA